jgi:hypothetical protein
MFRPNRVIIRYRNNNTNISCLPVYCTPLHVNVNELALHIQYTVYQDVHYTEPFYTLVPRKNKCVSSKQYQIEETVSQC